MNENQKAVVDCDRALKLEPGNIKGLVRKAQALLNLTKYEESLETIQEGKKIHPKSKDLLQLESKIKKSQNQEKKQESKIYQNMFSEE